MNKENINENSRADETNNDSSFIDRIGHYINALSDKKDNPNSKYRFLKHGDQEKLEKLIDKLYNDAPSCKNMIRQKLNLQESKNLNESSFMEKSFSLLEENSKEPDKENQNLNQMDFIGVDNSFNEVSIDNESENEKKTKTSNKKKEEEKINYNGYNLRSRDKIIEFKSPKKLNNRKNFTKANVNSKRSVSEIKLNNKKSRKKSKSKSKSKSPVIKIEDTCGKSGSSEMEEEEEEPEIIVENFQDMIEKYNMEEKKKSPAPIKIPNFRIDRVSTSSKNEEKKIDYNNNNSKINKGENKTNTYNNLNKKRIIQKGNNSNIDYNERQNINQNINNYSSTMENSQTPCPISSQYSNQQNSQYLNNQYVNNQDINSQINYFQNQNPYLNMPTLNNNQYYNQNIYNSQYENEFKPTIIYDELVSLADKFGANNIIDYLLMYNFNDFNNHIQDELFQKLKNILLREKIDDVIILLIKIVSNNYYCCQQKIVSLLKNTRKINNEVYNYNNNLYYQQQMPPQNIYASPVKNDLLNKKRTMCHSPTHQHNQIKNGTSERKKFFFNVEKY